MVIVVESISAGVVVDSKGLDVVVSCSSGNSVVMIGEAFVVVTGTAVDVRGFLVVVCPPELDVVFPRISSPQSLSGTCLNSINNSYSLLDSEICWKKLTIFNIEFTVGSLQFALVIENCINISIKSTNRIHRFIIATL